MENIKEFIANFRYLFPQIGQYKKSAIKSIIATIIETIFELSVPTIVAIIVDRAISNKDLALTIELGALMIVISLACMYTGAEATRFAATTSSGFAANLRKTGFHKVQEYGFRDIEKFGPPSLITRLTGDIQQITFSVFLGTRFIVKTGAMAVIAIILSVRISAKLSLIFLVILPLVVLILFSIISRAIPTFRKFRKEFDNLNLVVQENLANMRVVKAFVRNDFEIRKFDKQNNKMFKLIDKGAGYMSFVMPIANFAMFLNLIAIIWLGGNEIIAGNIGVGELTSFITYSMMLLGAFLGMSMITMQMMITSPSVVRLAEIIKYEPEMDLSKSKEDLEVKSGSIDFDKVYFRYEDDSDNYALSNIDLHIKEGETIGILGPTGSSKSTLAQLIPRLYDVSDGQIKIGGENIENYTLEKLRSQVNVVLQKNTLFSGTIEENLRWGNADASFEEIKHAAEIACADEFIMKRDGGYQSVLGQGGVGVSGGQKQRLCIARSLLTRPKILILDNSTSAVDTKTEAKIRDGLKEFDSKMTKIIISQRVSSFKDADRIIVMNEGKIDGIGSHEQLYKTNDVYRLTYDIQEKGDSDNE